MLSISLVALFLCVALLSGLAATQVLGRMAPASRRLRDLTPNSAGTTASGVVLTDTPDPTLERLSRTLPKSPKEMTRLRARLASAGYYDLSTAIYYSASRFILPVALAVPWLVLLPMADGWPFALCFVGIGAMLPDLWLRRKIRAHAKAITNGLPDVLDLLIVCIEAGSGLDQAIAKASEELDLTHPALTRELRFISTEIRAGVARMEAFQNFAQRTQVEDVQTLVTMIQQTDRFGTSIARALRTHADTSRTKRRQRAEERAKKVGVKLVFPLVFCVFPAVYMVCIGPAVIAIYRAFF
jgi:tight adherence protein C